MAHLERYNYWFYNLGGKYIEFIKSKEMKLNRINDYLEFYKINGYIKIGDLFIKNVLDDEYVLISLDNSNYFKRKVRYECYGCVRVVLNYIKYDIYDLYILRCILNNNDVKIQEYIKSIKEDIKNAQLSLKEVNK